MPTRILIVEDDPAYARCLRRVYRDYGEVDVAESFDDAKARIERVPWSLLSLDVGLGARSGLDLLRHARARKAPYTGPAFVVTAHASAELVRACCELAARLVPKASPEAPYDMLGSLRRLVLADVRVEIAGEHPRARAFFDGAGMTRTVRAALVLAANGRSDAEIMQALGIASARALAFHRKNINDKLGCPGGSLCAAGERLRAAVHPEIDDRRRSTSVRLQRPARGHGSVLPDVRARDLDQRPRTLFFQ